jgi:hypothetical protein
MVNTVFSSLFLSMEGIIYLDMKNVEKKDNETVCEICKRINTTRKKAILQLAVAFILLSGDSAFLFLASYVIINSDLGKSVGWAGFFIGIVCGGLFILLAVQIIKYIIVAMINLKGKPEDRLLIKYHDSLMKKK